MRPLLLLFPLALCAQDFSKISIEKVTANYRFTEGPAWSRDGFLLYSDVPHNKIVKYTPGEKPVFYREESNGASGNAFDERGRLYTCETVTRRVTRTDKAGKIEVLAEKWEGKRFNAPNDIVVRRDGHAWFTDPAFAAQLDTRELDFFGVFHIAPRGQLSVAAKLKGRPNGIALSPNGHLLYVANSDERTVLAYDVDRNGAAANERVLISGITGVPGGLAVDEKGNIYVACQGIGVYTPLGKLLKQIELSETAANLAFGDADLKTLYITARTSVYRIRLDVKGSLQY
jgi:gluconolactonase